MNTPKEKPGDNTVTAEAADYSAAPEQATETVSFETEELSPIQTESLLPATSAEAIPAPTDEALATPTAEPSPSPAVQITSISELSPISKYGKIWTVSDEVPGYSFHSNLYSDDSNKDMDTPGHIIAEVYDYLGNQYKDGFFIDGLEYAEYYASYYLGDLGYTRFTGVCSMYADMKDNPLASNFSKYFEVYGDGVLLFRSLDMKNGSEPQKFIIDISDIRILTIKYPKTSGPSRIAMIFDGELS